ncbi:MAG: DNA-processing protein DprA [Chloroflexota bacterium]|nr:DNA-processing protein DprA [Chloroflexota bacterium]
MNEIKYWVGFTLIPGIGRARISRLARYFDSMEGAWHASATELEAAGLDARSVRSIMSHRPKVSLDEEMEKLERYRVTATTIEDEGYPARLKEIYDPPPILFVRGHFSPQDDWSLAVVGTRQPTYYGREIAEQIAGDLARNRITVVSGLARGIDSIAHRTALDSGGRTIAVLGCGLDVIYPSQNVNMAREIIEHGALVSEYPLGTPPKRENFPLRNRIMSGLSLGVLVVEGKPDSGARITVDRAVEQNRDVFAVPGNVLSPMSGLPNQLIQEGAKLVRNAEDIMEELNLTMAVQHAKAKDMIPATDTEHTILQYLSPEPIHIDELGRRCDLSISTISSTLAMMELKGMVKQVGGMNYTKLRESREEYKVKIE